MNPSKLQLVGLVLLRLTVGWHFLYEGAIKFYNPYWSAKGYLLSAEGWFIEQFNWLAQDSVVGLVDTATIAMTVGVGLLLLLGVFTRFAAMAGIVLLTLFYLAHPPLHGNAASTLGGSYWLVNYNLVEIAALLVIFSIPTSHIFGLDNLRQRKS